MATLVRGVVSSVYVPLPTTITVTPDAGAKVSVSGRAQDGSALTTGDIYAATDITAPAGSTFSFLAENGGATHTDPSFTAAQSDSLRSLVSGAWNRIDELGYPDPRRPAAVLGHFVLPGQTAQVLNALPESRLLAFTTNATNTNAGCSTASNAGRVATTLAGATDAVGLRYADLGKPIPLTTITTGSSAIALVVEIQE